MKLFPTVMAAMASLAAAHAVAATAEEIYKDKCSTCHDAGLASAPRIGDKVEWARRNRQGTDALYKAALQGKPNTAMMAKGGFNELSDAQVTAVVDYLLAQAGQTRRIATAANKSAARAGEPLSAVAPRPGVVEKVDDEALVARIRALLDKTKGIVAKDIKLEAADGVVTLRGVVDNADQIKRAEAVAEKTRGVRKVDNKLIPKDMFAWD
jgi:cytochrome c5